MSNTQVASPPSHNEPSSDIPAYLLLALELVVLYINGQISYEQYEAKLDAWWQEYHLSWQENDLSDLFRLICLTD